MQIPVGAIVALAILLAWQITDILTVANSVYQSSQLVTSVRRLRRYLNESALHERGYLLTGATSYHLQFADTSRQASYYAAEAERLAGVGSSQQASVRA